MATNNIIAQFACSVWKSTETDRMPTNKQVGDFKDYRVVSGSTFNEEYNDTLDSASLVLSQITKEDRLFNIKQYQYVRVFDASGNTSYDNLLLVDTFSEKENNIKEHLFSYVINLMSETKLLEKWQCPNLAITHEVNADGSTSKKTIYQYIKQYMELYVPKMKFSTNGITWDYVPIITVPDQFEADGETETLFYQKFGHVYCADLAFSAPTLRQLLTMLMQQVGCIPVVKNRVLGFLDFAKEAVPFGGEDYTINNTVNYIQRNASSDSFVNTLVNLSDNVLDADNEVICETMGFRDRQNVLLKQMENLSLETKFPIYKIDKFYVKNLGVVNKNDYYTVPATWQGTFLPNNGGFLNGQSRITITSEFVLNTHDGESYNKRITIQWQQRVPAVTTMIAQLRQAIIQDGTSYSYWGWHFTNITIHCCQKTNTGEIIEVRQLDKNSIGVYTVDSNQHTLSDFYARIYDSSYGNGTIKAYIDVQDDINYNIFWIEGDLVPCLYNIPLIDINNCVDYNNYSLDPNYINSIGIINGSKAYIYCDINSISSDDISYKANIIGNYKFDLTPILKENSIRNNLNNNFLEMGNANTLQELGNYIYGTVGYSIGSNVISGFSSTYTVGENMFLFFGWYDTTYTFIENILNFIRTHYQSSDLIYEYASLNVPNYPYADIELTDEEIEDFKFTDSGIINNFSYLLFDLYYQPLNSFRLTYSKQNEDIDFPIEQYDGSASGLTDFDRLSIHEQEQVNRIGNPVLAISQRTLNISDIQTFEQGPLYFMDDTNRDGEIDSEDDGTKYIIFKRSFQINNNCLNASYIGSKDSILKNYFTSIRTKYRAYQYIDYSQSILRKENKTIFVRIGEDFYAGDDNIRLGSWSTNYLDSSNLYFLSYFIDGIQLKNNDNMKIKSLYEKDPLENFSYKNEISTITNVNSFAIIYKDFDNASPGVWLSPNGTNNLSGTTKIAGVPQGWYLFSDNFHNQQQLFYTFYSVLSKPDIFLQYSDETYSYAAHMLPKDKVATKEFYKNSSRTDFVAFTFCDYNWLEFDDTYLTTYKDRAEQIQRTLQFSYYTTSKYIRFSESFIKNNSFIHNTNFSFMSGLIYGNVDDFKNGNWFLENGNRIGLRTSLQNNLNNFITIKQVLINGKNMPCIEVDWNGIESEFGSNISVVDIIGVHPRIPGAPTGIFTANDIIAFKKPEEGGVQRYFVTLNDTKTDYVMSEKNGILYRKYKVETGDFIRSVQELYVE